MIPTRVEILNGLPVDSLSEDGEEDIKNYLGSILEEFEDAFYRIKNLLDIESIRAIGDIEEAHDLALDAYKKL